MRDAPAQTLLLGQFLPVAAGFGLDRLLDRWVVSRALLRASRITRHGVLRQLGTAFGRRSELPGASRQMLGKVTIPAAQLRVPVLAGDSARAVERSTQRRRGARDPGRRCDRAFRQPVDSTAHRAAAELRGSIVRRAAARCRTGARRRSANWCASSRKAGAAVIATPREMRSRSARAVARRRSNWCKATSCNGRRVINAGHELRPSRFSDAGGSRNKRAVVQHLARLRKSASRPISLSL